MRVRKRRSARPVGTERSNTATPTTAEIQEVKGDNTAGDTTHLGECPVCGSAGKLVIEPRHTPGRPPYFVICRTATCKGLGSGEWLRAVADLVDAPGGWDILDSPLEYLSAYLEATSQGGAAQQPPSLASVDGHASRLWTEPDPLAYALNVRGMSEETLRREQIGWDGKAFTFPIYDANGELVNWIRRPWPNAPAGAKYIGLRGHNRHNGGVELYPRPLPRGSWLVIEGLWDALLGRQHGLKAVTSTHGVDTFLPEWLPLVRSRRVAVMYDVGAETVMHRRVAQLREAGADAWPVQLAKVLRRGKDLSDALTGGWTADALAAFIKSEREAARRKQAA
jgi:hypothetical protein